MPFLFLVFPTWFKRYLQCNYAPSESISTNKSGYRRPEKNRKMCFVEVVSAFSFYLSIKLSAREKEKETERERKRKKMRERERERVRQRERERERESERERERE